MHINELTFNELLENQVLPHDWGHIDLSEYDYSEDEEVCFKLIVWSLQCKFSKLVKNYFKSVSLGIRSKCSLNELIHFKIGLEILNSYNVRDINSNTTEYNTETFIEIKRLIKRLNNY